MSDLRLAIAYEDLGDQRDARGRSLSGWRYDVKDAEGFHESERFYQTEGQARSAGKAAVEAERKRRLLRREFEKYAVDGEALLDAPEDERVKMTGGGGGGDKCLPYMKGLDVLECMGIRRNDVAAERVRRKPAKARKPDNLKKTRPANRICLSPWDRRATNPRDRVWLDKLRLWFPDKPWKLDT